MDISLPKVSERVKVFDEAKSSFLAGWLDMGDNLFHPDATLGDTLMTYTHVMNHLLSDGELALTAEAQDHLLHLLVSIAKEYNLTDGEKLSLLSTLIQRDTSSILSYERGN